MIIQITGNSTKVIFAAWREDVDDQRLFERGCAVFHSAAHHKRVPCPDINRFPLARNLQVTMNHLHDLVVWMAVCCPSPPFHHFVLRNK
jgi:hypothetical protein